MTDQICKTDTMRHVVVIGGGIVGVTAAVVLRQKGYKVSLVSTDTPGSQDTASYGNAGWLSPGSVVPLSMPGMWKKIPSYLFSQQSPLRLRLSAVPQACSWLVRFVLSGATQVKARQIATHLRPFLAECVVRHKMLAQAMGQPDFIQEQGLLIVYPNEASYQADSFAWQLRKENQVIWNTLDRPALDKLCPTLSAHYQFGAYLPQGGHCNNPGGYVAALAEYAKKQGVVFITDCVEGVRQVAGSVASVVCQGHELECDQVIIAAGIGARKLASQIGDYLPLMSERGYHVELPGTTQALSLPVMMSDLKFGITPMAKGLRAAGQVEFAPKKAPPDWRRAHILYRCLSAGLPNLEKPSFASVQRWMGNRPSTPDCLPVVSQSAHIRGVLYATGHGHLGLASAPYTAELLVQLLSSEHVTEAEPYTIKRFGFNSAK